MDNYLITSALLYANGPLHFGHLVGAYLPADIMARHFKIQGEKAVHISGSDDHGVAIMLNAKKAGMDYKSYVDKWSKFNHSLLEKYGVDFDFFGQTSSDYHQKEVVQWFKKLHQDGFIETRDNQQLFCNDCGNHLPDRFVEGVCYECGFERARGDECPKCGVWIEAVKLGSPVCKICSSQNVKEVTATQYYLLLSKYHQEFRNWFEQKNGEWRKPVYTFADSLTVEKLHDRAITRDLDWGIDVPLEEDNAKGKKLYVWFDAPIGYVSNLKQYLKETGSNEDYQTDWWKNDNTKIINFIGKDNIIFHAVIFPVMSMASEMVNPVSDLPANQFLNLEGKQFSKSSGWYIDADEAMDDFGQDSLRYYLISMLPEGADSSFSWENFGVKVNNELANNVGNLVNRCFKFWGKNWKDGIAKSSFKPFLESVMAKKLTSDIKEYLELVNGYQLRKGLEKIMAIGGDANTYFSDRAPWAEFKTDKSKAAETMAGTGIYIMVIAVLLSPYLPKLSEKILSHFGNGVTSDIKREIYCGNFDLLGEFSGDTIAIHGKVEALVPKIEDDQIKKQIEKLKNVAG